MNDKGTRRADAGAARMPTQLEVVRQVMCLAAQYGAWMTLAELARKTDFPEASISAVAAFAKGGTRRMGGDEEEEGMAGGVEDEYAGAGVGIPAERVVVHSLVESEGEEVPWHLIGRTHPQVDLWSYLTTARMRRRK